MHGYPVYRDTHPAPVPPSTNSPRRAEALAVAAEQLDYWRRNGLGSVEIYDALGTPFQERSLCPRRNDLLSLIAAAWLGVAR